MPPPRSPGTPDFLTAQLPAILFGLFGGLTIAWCVASLWLPFGWDHGILAAVGDVIVRGGMPYRDGWDMKGPLAFYGFALAQWTFGRAMSSVHLLDVVLLAAACFALGRLVASVTTRRIGQWAAIGFALWYASLGWFFVAQPDGWVAMLSVAGVVPLLLTAGPVRLRAVGWSGVAIGACALIKPFYLAFLIVPAVFVLFGDDRRTRQLSALIVLGLAAILPIAVVIAWFYRQNALDSLIEVHVTYAGAYAESLRPDLVARRVFNYFWSNGAPTPTGAIAVALPAVVYGAWALIREHRRLGLTLGVWLAVALFCVVIQGKFWVYHWVPTFPPFVILAAIGLCRLAASAEWPAAPVAVAATSAALFLGTVSVTPTVDVGRWLALLAGITTREQYDARHFRRYYNAADNVAAAKHIREATTDAEEVVVWGNDTTINFLSGRKSPTRFVFAMPLTRDVADALRAEYRREYMAALSARPPRYLVIGQPHDGSIDKAAVLRTFPELQLFIESRYRLERQIGFLELYRRAD